jgi:hypothetical protein
MGLAIGTVPPSVVSSTAQSVRRASCDYPAAVSAQVPVASTTVLGSAIIARGRAHRAHRGDARGLASAQGFRLRGAVTRPTLVLTMVLYFYR